ncbi:MAG: prealbumin-like fold domain-containing protein, partial [Hyphomicrobiaceae bacterium]
MRFAFVRGLVVFQFGLQSCFKTMARIMLVAAMMALTTSLSLADHCPTGVTYNVANTGTEADLNGAAGGTANPANNSQIPNGLSDAHKATTINTLQMTGRTGVFFIDRVDGNPSGCKIGQDDNVSADGTGGGGTADIVQGTWHSDTPVCFVIVKSSNEAFVQEYATPQTEGSWTTIGRIENNQGIPQGISHLDFYGCDSEGGNGGNGDDGNLIITKTTTDGETESFTFTVEEENGSPTFVASRTIQTVTPDIEQNGTPVTLAFGKTYTVTESFFPTGWTLDNSLTCS